MREVTVKEFVKAFEGKKVCIESVDSYGIMLSMANAHIEYREEENELVLGGGARRQCICFPECGGHY